MMEASGLPPNYQHAIEWLQAPPESKKIYERHLTTGLPGTANWIFEEVRYQEWLHATGRNTLWIFGPPGCGKSVLSALVIQYLLKSSPEKTGLAYFFFSRDHELDTVLALFSALLSQLWIQVAASVSSIEGSWVFEALDFCNRPAVDKVFALLIKTLSIFDRVSIIIDGLDECRPDDRPYCLRLINHLRLEYSDKLYVLITSRRNLDIEEALKTSTPSSMILFQNHVSDQNIPSIAYKELLGRISAQQRSLAKSAFTWLTFALGPLSVDALAEAVVLREYDLDLDPEIQAHETNSLRNVLASFVSLGPDTSIRLNRDLLNALYSGIITKDALGTFYTTQDEVWMYLAECCVQYVLFYARSGAREGNANDLGTFPLLRYASRYWIPHLRQLWEVYTKEEQSRIERLTLRLLSDDVALDRCLSVFDPQDPGREPFSASPSRDPAVFYAVRTGIEGVVTAMINSGAVIAECDGLGRQPLHLAVANDDTHIVEVLVAHNASTTARDKRGETPLSIAAFSSSSSQTLDVLLKHTDAKSLSDLTVEEAPFIWVVAQNGTGEVLDKLISHLELSVEKLNVGDKDGRTLLHIAAASGNTSAISSLLKAGADVNVGDNEHDRPLHLAVRFDQEEAREMLIDGRADPTLINRKKETPLAESWTRKSLNWNSYQVDIGLEANTNMSRPSQATCHILSKHGDCPGPQIIFSKTYDWSHLDSDKNRKDERRPLLISLMREKKSLQRLDHPFIVSYLGFIQLEEGKSKYSLYLEYCDGGDLETRHVNRMQQHKGTASGSEEDEELLAEAGVQDSSDTNSLDEEPPNSKKAVELRALNERAVWTLMYQLFAALAYLHYGISISKEGACRVEHHWDTMLHRDIKPHNIVLKSGPKSQRIAKLCDLGHVRNWKASGLMTVPTHRGTREYWPPEIKGADLTLEERHHQWSTKGDVWCLASQ
ncbi:hypothetical protein B5807_01334 [Epicoccum nigrum]|uniref:Protein kinase domain-containing protein n=1 Tax=Epicoccum nigrum TaxID=105696 RepID=A0A1Y2MFI3_EPING|nr:hypothetical protein B5807_01334 [Epicoccum nigrum]